MRRQEFENDMEILAPILVDRGYGINYISEVIEPFLWKSFEHAHHIDNMTGGFIYAHLVKNVGKTVASKIANSFDDAKRGESQF